MPADELWRVFSETGDPLAYLLYKSMQDQPRRNDKNKTTVRAESLPRPED